MVFNFIKPTENPMARSVIISLPLSVVFLSYGIYIAFWWQQAGFLWDLPVYTRAVADNAIGTDAYRLDVSYPFVYHPLVLRAFTHVNNMVPLPIFLLALFFGSTYWFYSRAYRFAQTSPSPASSIDVPDFIVVVITAFGFGGAGIASFMSGNITTSLHLLLAGCFFNSLRSPSLRSHLFLICMIVLSSVIKPYLLAYSFYFILLSDKKHAIAIIASISVMTLGIWLSGFLAFPVEFIRFIEALRYTILTINDTGFSIYGFVRSVSNDFVSTVFHLVTILIAVVVLLGARKRHATVTNDQMALGVLVLIVLMNPRMKEYDFFIAVTALILWIRLYLPQPAQWIISLTTALALTPGIATILKVFGIMLPSIFYSLKWQAICFGVLVVLAMVERNKQNNLRL
jgi:hypothetical protein